MKIGNFEMNLEFEKFELGFLKLKFEIENFNFINLRFENFNLECRN